MAVVALAAGVALAAKFHDDRNDGPSTIARLEMLEPYAGLGLTLYTRDIRPALDRAIAGEAVARAELAFAPLMFVFGNPWFEPGEVMLGWNRDIAAIGPEATSDETGPVKWPAAPLVALRDSGVESRLATADQQLAAALPGRITDARSTYERSKWAFWVAIFVAASSALAFFQCMVTLGRSRPRRDPVEAVV